LGPGWTCAFANDFDSNKARTYTENWGADELIIKDIHDLKVDNLPGRVHLAWASFPCQDVSCAGNGLGIGAEHGKSRTRSGTFWPFVGLMRGLKKQKRLPKIIVVENVVGLLTNNSGSDFRSVATALADLGYRFGAVVVDARHFVPQSRKGVPQPFRRLSSRRWDFLKKRDTEDRAVIADFLTLTPSIFGIGQHVFRDTAILSP
jgi:DNA (cytosine-5)-methyltransferase 1